MIGACECIKKFKFNETKKRRWGNCVIRAFCRLERLQPGSQNSPFHKILKTKPITEILRPAKLVASFFLFSKLTTINFIVFNFEFGFYVAADVRSPHIIQDHLKRESHTTKKQEVGGVRIVNTRQKCIIKKEVSDCPQAKTMKS